MRDSASLPSGGKRFPSKSRIGTASSRRGSATDHFDEVASFHRIEQQRSAERIRFAVVASSAL
jgi:hypothetical protein